MAHVIDTRNLEKEDVELLEKLAERLRERAERARATPEEKSKEDNFMKSAGAWEGLVNSEELIRNIYADRLISTRPEAKL